MAVDIHNLLQIIYTDFFTILSESRPSSMCVCVCVCYCNRDPERQTERCTQRQRQGKAQTRVSYAIQCSQYPVITSTGQAALAFYS